jgi:hypothetical protein
MVSEYVVGQWLFVRVGLLDSFGQFVHAKEHQVVVDVWLSEPMPAAYIPSKAPALYQYISGYHNPPLRVDFGRAISLIVCIDPPMVWQS